MIDVLGIVIISVMLGSVFVIGHFLNKANESYEEKEGCD
jgi:hypothetical protein